MEKDSSESNIALKTLKKYWGYDSFRPPQNKIIDAILLGNDTIALLPTGGGKSICFQVPGLILEGLCLVISPLIALMKDQVENLKKREISAEALFSGQKSKEQNAILEKAVSGDLKFLYISPERLAGDDFRGWLKNMQLSLLAIDEAHCISQWGYDFRPEYLEIAQIRNLFPQIPVMALTASATKEVLMDMVNVLEFKNTNHIYRKSFERKNLFYAVRKEDNKSFHIIEGIKKIKGTGIVYTRNRRGTEALAKILVDNQISADFYHAGLDIHARSKKQKAWIDNKTRVMVCTNAFGMGIDKPDVRFVIHLEPPDCLESYYQEAGRAGRDENSAFCALFFNESDLERETLAIEERYPENKFLNQVYQLVCAYLGIVEGSGKGHSYEFDLEDFCKEYNLKIMLVYNSIKLLHTQGYWNYSESGIIRSSLKINLSEHELYTIQVGDEFLNALFLTILRTRGGYFDFYTPIDELKIALLLNIQVKKVCETLEMLHKKGWVEYQGKSTLPHITLLEPRYGKINPDRKKIDFLKQRAIYRNQKMTDFLLNQTTCRNRIICDYFNSEIQSDCGTCDNCRKKKKSAISQEEIVHFQQIIKNKLTASDHITLEDLKKSYAGSDLQKITFVLDWMLRNEWVIKKDGGVLIWKK
jgi:ATP-dependent DNA helicase RecQ